MSFGTYKCKQFPSSLAHLDFLFVHDVCWLLVSRLYFRAVGIIYKKQTALNLQILQSDHNHGPTTNGHSSTR